MLRPRAVAYDDLGGGLCLSRAAGFLLQHGAESSERAYARGNPPSTSRMSHPGFSFPYLSDEGVFGILTQLRRGSSVVERRTENPCVASSILALGTSKTSCIRRMF